MRATAFSPSPSTTDVGFVHPTGRHACVGGVGCGAAVVARVLEFVCALVLATGRGRVTFQSVPVFYIFVARQVPAILFFE